MPNMGDWHKSKEAKRQRRAKRCPCGIGPATHAHNQPDGPQDGWTSGRDMKPWVKDGRGQYVALNLRSDYEARLIAAAPALLAAAKALEESLNTWANCVDPRHMGGTCLTCETRAAARAAIAKAGKI